MSCFNAARYLADAIESIRSQTFTEFEFVIVDDGSTDKTLRIIKDYAAEDHRVVVLQKENTGLADSLNLGMRRAHGEWIARLDADDVALPHRLETQLAYVDSRPATVLVGSGFIEIDSTGKPLRNYRYPALHDCFIRRIEKIASFPPHSSCLYRKALAEAQGGFNPRFHRSQDADLWFRLSLVGEIAAVPDPLVKIRKHGNNISNDAGGNTQALFGTAAHVCHLLRTRGIPDPSAQTDAIWREFMEWLTASAAQRGLFEQKQEWSRLKHCYFSSHSRARGAFRLVKGLVASRHTLSILHKKCFGSSLARSLADEWTERQCAASSG